MDEKVARTGALKEVRGGTAAPNIEAPQPLRPYGATDHGRRFKEVPAMVGSRPMQLSNLPCVPPDWDMWRCMPSAQAWAAVALSLNCEPGNGMPVDVTSFGTEFPKRLRVVMAHLALPTGTALRVISGNPTSPFAIVSIPDFGTWAANLGWPIPAEFPRAAPEVDATTSIPPSNPGHWPWGNHHTETLGHLEEAAKRYWMNYDPLDSTTAATNEVVSTWLQTERKVSKSKADAIASMLRKDGLPMGPRK